MKDFKPTVVHANDLVKASYSLTTHEQRLILLGCSKVNSKGKPTGEIFISVKDYELAFGVEKDNRTYSYLRDAAKALMRKPIKLFNTDTRKMRELAWLAMDEYEVGDNGAGVTIEFSHKIVPFLFELKKNFTSINFDIAAKLKTPFSFRLYQWLKEAEHKNKNKIEHNAIEVILELDWMKEQAQLVGTYDVWQSFNTFVIKPALKRINAVTDISVFHQPVKAGRKVKAVRFTFVQEHTPFLSKPLRPRLYRRPKVIKGSHEEGVWMRKNLAILLDYEKALKAYDKYAKMDLPDLRKMAEYASICDTFLEERLRKEIKKRELKSKKQTC